MKVDVKKLNYGEPTVLEEIVSDREKVASLLGADPVGDFIIRAKCTLTEEGLLVKFSAKGECYARCDRCGEAAVAKCQSDFTEILTEGDKEFDYVTESYDLSGLEDECIVLSEPMSVLCKEDCKGLCPVCGANLNDGEHKCK